MNRLMGILLISIAGVAWSTSWYTSVAVDSSGLVCAGSVGSFNGNFVPAFTPGFLYCQNGKIEAQYMVSDIVMAGQDSVLFSYVSMDNGYQIDSSGIGISSLSIYDEGHIGLRSILPVSVDSILFADQSGMFANDFAFSNSRTIAGLPIELATSPVRSLAKDFKNRLWAGTDSGVWVQDAEGDTTWTYHAVGWPVKNIFPIDTNQVMVASFHMALDGYDATTAKKACFENDSMRASCSTTAYALVNLCPRPGA